VSDPIYSRIYSRIHYDLDYRTLHPVFHTERFTVNGNPGADAAQAELWTASAAGHYAMAETAYF